MSLVPRSSPYDDKTQKGVARHKHRLGRPRTRSRPPALAGKPAEVIRARARGRHLKEPKRKYEGRRVSWVYSEAAERQTHSALPGRHPGSRGGRPGRPRAAAVAAVARETGEQRATTPLRPALLPLLAALTPPWGSRPLLGHRDFRRTRGCFGKRARVPAPRRPPEQRRPARLR